MNLIIWAVAGALLGASYCFVQTSPKTGIFRTMAVAICLCVATSWSLPQFGIEDPADALGPDLQSLARDLGSFSHLP